MEVKLFALVIVEYPIKTLDKEFVYQIPGDLINVLKPGMKVQVPFGTKNIFGFVYKIIKENTTNYEAKEIVKIIDKEIILTNELIKLGKKISKTTLSPRISVYNSMFPPSFKVKKVQTNYNKYKTFYSLNINQKEIKEYINKHQKNKREIYILEKLIVNNEVIKDEINYPNSLKTLLQKGLIKEKQEQTYRINDAKKEKRIFKLTDEQNKIIKNIKLDEHSVNLIHGVTGSGKTEVYINLINEVIKEGKSAIMLVPEISLSYQIVSRFYEKFGNRVAIFHSSLSAGEKHDEYLKIIRNEVDVVVGTRSAVFVPFENLGIVIIDEEHSRTYKQDTTPKYNAIDVAIERCIYHNAPLILGSATPNVNSYAKAIVKRYNLFELTKRVNNSKLPNVYVEDKTEDLKQNNNLIMTNLLKNKLIDTIKNNKQAIILLNRRGHSTFISCSSCGHTYKCPNCDITLTFHKSTENLICHYCSYLVKKDKICPSCKKDSLTYLGLGTEKLETYINENIAGAKVIRMDQDTTSRKGSHEKIINSFKNKEYNILLGTEMISKGFDFDDVELVGIINADNSLNIPNYKALEETFSLLTQASGRAGRRDSLGEVVIETFNPELPVFDFIKKNDYKSFFEEEIKFRKKLQYPPFVNIVSIKVISKDYHKSLNSSKLIVERLHKSLDKKHIILGPTTHALFKLKNEFRFQIIIKYKNSETLLNVLKKVDQEFTSKDIRLDIDINPNSI